jgi:hypothetical protein
LQTNHSDRHDQLTATRFAENLRLFGKPQAEPEKYNLYNGLVNLASAVEQMQSPIAEIETKVNRVLSEVKK